MASISAGATAVARCAEASRALLVAAVAEPALLADIAALSVPVADERISVAHAGYGCRFAVALAVALNAVDLRALLVAQRAEPAGSAKGAGMTGPVPADVVVEACAAGVALAVATSVARAAEATRADEGAVASGVARRALALSRSCCAVVAQAVAEARGADLHAGAPRCAGRRAPAVVACALSCRLAALTVAGTRADEGPRAHSFARRAVEAVEAEAFTAAKRTCVADAVPVARTVHAAWAGGRTCGAVHRRWVTGEALITTEFAGYAADPWRASASIGSAEAHVVAYLSLVGGTRDVAAAPSVSLDARRTALRNIPKSFRRIEEAAAGRGGVTDAVSCAWLVVFARTFQATHRASVHRIAGADAVPAPAVARARFAVDHGGAGDRAVGTVEREDTPLTSISSPESDGIAAVADALPERGVAPPVVVAPSAIR